MTIALYLAAFILHGSEQQLSVNAIEVGNYNFLMMKKNNFVLLEFDFDPLCAGVPSSHLGHHVGFVVDETGSGWAFLGVSPVFPYHKFHSTISPHSSHPFHFISSALVMVRQAWSAGTLATHGPIISGLHRFSSLDPTLCWTRVEDIYFYLPFPGRTKLAQGPQAAHGPWVEDPCLRC